MHENILEPTPEDEEPSSTKAVYYRPARCFPRTHTTVSYGNKLVAGETGKSVLYWRGFLTMERCDWIHDIMNSCGDVLGSAVIEPFCKMQMASQS